MTLRPFDGLKVVPSNVEGRQAQGQARAVWVTLSIAMVLHTVLAVSVAPRFEIDSAFYRAQAENLVNVGASLDADGRPETRYTPGYPIFLAAFLAAGLGYTGAIAAQHVIWVALTAVVMWLVIRTSRSIVAASAAGLIRVMRPCVSVAMTASPMLARVTSSHSRWCRSAS